MLAACTVSEAATLSVDSTLDTIAVDGHLTLREAILSIDAGADVDADATARRSGPYGSADAISFAIGSGAQAIAIERPLPVILKPLSLDGTTQPGYAGAILLTLDGSALPPGTSGLMVSSATTASVLALDVTHFPADGLVVGQALDRIFAGAFDPPQAPAGAPGWSALAVTGTLSLTGVTVDQNGAAGVAVTDAGALVNAQGLVANLNGRGGLRVEAGRVNVSGASQIAANSGDAPVAFGAEVAAGAVLTLTGTAAVPIAVSANNGVGLLVHGNLDGTYVDVAANGSQGIVVDSIDDPVFPEDATATMNVQLAAFDIHDNGGSTSPLPGGGVIVLRTRASTTTMNSAIGGLYKPERFVLREGPALDSQSRVHDNLGDGITLGGAASGLCAAPPSGLACGAVDAVVRNALVYGNQQGIVVQEQDAEESATVPNLVRNYITNNSGAGLHVYTSLVGFDANATYINGNTIGHNAWPSPTCSAVEAQETAPQVLFDGPVAAPASLVAACSAHADDPTACNLDRSHTCLWNQGVFDANGADPCRPSYLLSTNNCSSNANTITGYAGGVGGIGNPDLIVGVLAFNGAWVNGINVSWSHGGSLFENGDYSVDGQSSFFSDGPSGGEQTCTAAINKCPDHF